MWKLDDCFTPLRRQLSGVGDEDVAGLLGLTDVGLEGDEQVESWTMKTTMKATWKGIIVATRKVTNKMDAIHLFEVVRSSLRAVRFLPMEEILDALVTFHPQQL
jgi:hypothetical protein